MIRLKKLADDCTLGSSVTYILKVDEGIANAIRLANADVLVIYHLLAVVGEVNTEVHEVVQASACLVDNGL